MGSIVLNVAEVGCGTGDAVLGHPLEAAAWLADMKCAAGQSLKAGEVIRTGSLVKIEWPKNEGDVIDVEINDLGCVRITLL